MSIHLLYNPSFFVGCRAVKLGSLSFMNKTYRANEADTSCADMQVKRL
nr:MAG TPA: hypothetical protein [Caudoviricetes sp.]